MSIVKMPEKELETLRVLMIEALDSKNKCRCISCKGLMVMAKRIFTQQSTASGNQSLSNVRGK
jgi:hypothetical protein